MKQILLITFILTFLPTGAKVFGQSSDTNRYEITSYDVDTSIEKNQEPVYDETNDFSPGLLFFTLLGLGFILVCVTIGIVISTVALFVIFGFVSFGILSTSIIVGLNKRSFTKGFKIFLILISAIGGLVFWSIAFGIINKIMHWKSNEAAIIIGAACGLLAGLIFGFTASYLLQRLTNYFKSKLKIVNSETKGEWDIEY